MPHLLRLILILVITDAWALAAAGAQAQPNVLEIIVGNGPLAGTYKPPTSEIICLHAKKAKRYTAAWKNFNGQDAKAISEVGINVRIPMTQGRSAHRIRRSGQETDRV
ncbi:MAG: hypothetical protein ABL935_04990 [Nitrospiraceae bacterium]